MQPFIKYDVFSTYLKGAEKDKFTILKCFIEDNDVYSLNYFLKRREEIEIILNYGGDTLLHFACYKGFIEPVKLLLKYNIIDINKLDSVLRTPLHMAIKFGHTNLVKYLLEQGADPSIRCIHDELPLKSAIEREAGEIIELFLKKTKL
jgi:ankyrin repeat protein